MDKKGASHRHRRQSPEWVGARQTWAVGVASGIAAYATDYGLTPGQRACEEKSNEITAIEELLPALALEGTVVTIDAMGCQTAIAAQITEGGGDYVLVLAVKDNQPHLAGALRDFFAMLNTRALPTAGLAARDGELS